jgi:hypothetical protein
MPGYNTDGKAIMLGALRAAIDEISLHSSDPGNNGANEVSGGTYARWAVDTGDFTAVSGGAFATNDDHEFDGPAAGAATHFGIWADSTFVGAGAITGDTQFNSEGKFVLQSGTALDLNLEC